VIETKGGRSRWRGPVARGLAAWAVAVVLGGALAAWWPLDDWLAGRQDALLRWAAPTPPADAALVLDIDERSVARMGPWPLRRDAYLPAARWLEAAGARALVVGTLLVDPRPGDEAFARWLAEARMPVLMGARSLSGDGEGRPPQATPPGCRAGSWPAWQLPLWARESPAPVLPIQRVGALSMPLDEDGVLRHWPAWQRAGELSLPALPLAVWQALHPQAGALHCETGADGPWLRSARGPAWPLDQAHRLRPWLAPLPAGGPPLSLVQLDDAAAGRLSVPQTRALAERVRGRVLFIGSSALQSNEVLGPGGAADATVLLAATYDALAQGRVLAPPRPAATLALLALGLLPVLAGLRRRATPGRVLAAVAGAVALLLAADAALLLRGQQLVAIGWPLAMLASLAGLALWQGWRRAAAERARLQQARLEAELASRVKSEFLAHVSHEIRTPLHALLGSADLLAATALDARQARLVQLFQGAGQELLMMLGDLLDLSKAEAGLLTLSPQPFSLPRLVAGQVLMFEARAQQKGLSLRVESDPDLPDTVIGDAGRLAQVLRNLLSNAVKFTSVGGVTLAVQAVDGGRQIRFEVRDTGVGIAPERAARLFEPYVQASERTQAQYGGTGLGLAISRRLVQAMGGRLTLDSREGLGATFRVELPLPVTSARPQAVPSATPGGGVGGPSSLLPGGGGAAAGGVGLAGLGAATAAAAAAARWTGRGARGAAPLRLLLADDSPHALLLAQTYLDGAVPAPGASPVLVETVHDGAAALRRHELVGHDIVLMDLQMPVLGGAEAARRMRAAEQRGGRPPALLVALSGDADPDAEAQARAAGFDVCLGKPCTRAALLAALGLQAPLAGAAPGSARGPAEPPAAEAAALARISELPDSDLGEALDRLGSARLYRQVLEAATGPLMHFDARLAQALDTVPCDLELAHRLAHDLGSIAATLGLPGLAADARRLEQQLAVTVTPTEDRALDGARRAVAQRLVGVREVLRASVAAAAGGAAAEAGARAPASRRIGSGGAGVRH